MHPNISDILRGPKFLNGKSFCNVGVCMSIIVFEVLSKSLGSSLEGSKISLSDVIGYWVLDISIEGLAFGRGTSSSFSL